jgi:hypothetical protein
MRIFVAQSAVDRWMSVGGVAIEGDRLEFPAAPQAMLYIDPAVYFERIDGGETDAYDIIGAVKTQDELANMGAEHYETSVVLGEYAYTVAPGFMVTTVGPDGSEAPLDGHSWGTLLHAMETLGFS